MKFLLKIDEFELLEMCILNGIFHDDKDYIFFRPRSNRWFTSYERHDADGDSTEKMQMRVVSMIAQRTSYK